jgi:hypothetical protein
MVMTSSQISQLTAQSQQMGMQQMQHAAMISQQAGGMGGAGSGIGENLSGRVVNRGAAIAGPALGAGMALAGVDPFSMALKGGAAGFASGGIAGGLAGGMAAGGAVALPLMAAKYAGGQMMTGMQQQQQLQQQLQQSFHFQNRFGGRGFTRGEASTIGQQFRGMAAQRGPGGEHTTFEELSRLASNMGRMGMAQNTRSITEFQDNFKKMLTQVKAVAKAMSTSLEEAQEMMVGMRSSGVFRGQGQVAKDIRDIAGAGGLATSEVTGAMRIGSQISRMIGGRGRAGAEAGMQAIGMVGMAQQMGSLSEEDIYNVTGQTGAQGRQAMAAQMMQSSAAFLKSGLGRRVVASVAGKGGTLNAEAMEEYMYGGVGTGRTMQLAHANLAKIGRADFIRNEGRLRGQALGADPLIGVRALSGWLQQRGLDPNDDRTRIAMKRRMRGTSDEQLDAMLKMVQDLPKMQTQMAVSGARAEWSRRAQETRGRTGLQGVKKKFEAARDDVQNTLRQTGAEIYEDLTDMLDKWAADITGTVIQETAKGAADIAQDALKGGALGDYARARMGLGETGATRKALGGRRFGGLAAMAGGVTRRQAMKDAGDLERMTAAGYEINAVDQRNFDWAVGSARRTAKAYRMGVGGEAGQAAKSFGEKYRDELSTAAASGAISGSGWDRIQSFREYLAGSDDPEMKKIGEQLGRMDSEDAAAYMADIDSGTGIKASVLDSMKLPESRALLGGKAWKTDREATDAHADYFFGKTESDVKRRARLGIQEKKSFKGFIRFLQGKDQVGPRTEIMAIPGLGFGIRRLSAEQVEEQARAGERWRTEAGKITRGEQFLERSRVMLGDDQQAKDELRKKLIDENLELRAGVKDASLIEDPSKRARVEVNNMHMANMDVGSAAKSAGGIDKISDEKKQQLTRKYGKSWEELSEGALGAAEIVGEEERKARAQVFGEYGKRFAAAEIESGGTGFLKYNPKTGKSELSADAAKSLKASGKAGVAAAQKLAEAQETLSGLAGVGDEAEIAMFEKGQAQMQEAYKGLEDMTVAQKRAFAKGLRGAGGEFGRMRQTALAEASIQQQLEQKRTKGGAAGVMAQQLGLGIRGADLAGLDIKKQVQMMVGASGAEGEEKAALRKQLTAALESAKKGEMGEAAAGIRKAQTSPAMLRKEQASQDETAARQDPSYRALKGMHKLMGQLPNALADAMAGKKLKVDATGSFVTTSGSGDTECFPGFVKVTMADGTEKVIADIVEGDEVLSADPDTGELHTDVVVRKLVHELTRDLIIVNGVTATENHPFFVNDSWAQAANIKMGDTIKRLHGELHTEVVTSLVHLSRSEFAETTELDKVYNFETAKFHNYIAGGVLVHNEDKKKK